MSKVEGTDLFDIPVTTEQSEEQIIKQVDGAVDLFGDEEVEQQDDQETEDLEEEESEEQEETEEGEEELEEQDDDSIFESLKEAIIQKGFLKVEDKDSLKTQEDIVAAYQASIEEASQRNILEDLNKKLMDRGIDEYHLEIAMKLANGVDESGISELNYYKERSEKSFDKLSSEEAIAYCKEYLDKSNVAKSVKNRIIESLEADEEFLQTTFEDALQFNKNSYEELDEDQKELARQNLENKERIERESREQLSQILKSGEVMGEKVSDPKLFEKMVTQYSTTVEINGKEYPTTEWGKFLLDFQKDVSLRLWAFKQFKFKKEEIEQITEQAEEKGKVDLLKNFKKEKVQPIKKQNTKKTTPGVKTYIFGSGGITQKN